MKRFCKGCGLKLIKYLNYCPSCGYIINRDNYPESKEHSLDVFEFKDSKMLALILNMIILAGPFVYFIIYIFIVAPIYNIKLTFHYKLIALGLSFFLFSLALIILLILYISGVPKVYFLLTPKKIKVDLKNKILFQESWKSISKIELIMEIFPRQDIGRTKWTKGYIIIFIVSDKPHTLRLWNLPIQKRHKSFLLSSLQMYFNKMKIKIIDEGKTIRLSKSDYLNISKDMRKFNKVSSNHWLLYRRPKIKKNFLKMSLISQIEEYNIIENDILNKLNKIPQDFKNHLNSREKIEFFYHYKPRFPLKTHILRIVLGISTNIILFVLPSLSPYIPDWFFLLFMGIAFFTGLLCIGSLGQIVTWKKHDEKNLK